MTDEPDPDTTAAHPPPDTQDGTRMLANRLRKNLRRLRPWLKHDNVGCYRLYDADMPEYALAVDIYADNDTTNRWVHAQEYEAPRSVDPDKARARLREALETLPAVLDIPPGHLFFKVRRRQKGDGQYQPLARKQVFHRVHEGGLKFLVNFEDYLDTGLFLDHRLTRAMLREMAGGADFLNLFAYTGTASVYAAAGGARSTTTVDMSRTYLDWARRNMALNDFTGGEHTFIQADCIEWLGRNTRRRFDLIFLDPPSFSASKRMDSTFDVQRDHVGLLRATAKLLAPAGILVFSNNRRRFKMHAEALPELEIENISRATLPRDFQRNPRIHNCWKIRHRSPEDSRQREQPDHEDPWGKARRKTGP